MPDIYSAITLAAIGCALGLSWCITTIGGAVAAKLATDFDGPTLGKLEQLFDWSLLLGIVFAAGLVSFGSVALIWHLTTALG